jgi:hypothetical protein
MKEQFEKIIQELQKMPRYERLKKIYDYLKINELTYQEFKKIMNMFWYVE